MDSLGEPVNFPGNPHGGLCALEAALLSHHLRAFVLYEPSFAVGDAAMNPPEVVERLEATLRAGDRDGS